MLTKTCWKAVLILTIVSLVLSACRGGRGPVSPTPTPQSAAFATEAAGPQTVAINAVDDGAPLPPHVVTRHPAGGEALLPQGELQLAFDQPMEPDLTAAALQVTDADGSEIAGSVDWIDERTLRFKPDNPLETGSLYFASLETSAVSTAGVSLSEPFGFQFQTTADLEVSQVFPADGAQDVSADGVITVIFNRPVTPLVIVEERGDLPEPLTISPRTPGSGEWVSTSVYAFRPTDGLQAGIEYSVIVNSGLEDSEGESRLVEDYTWKFTTAQPAIEWFSLPDGRYNPQNGADKVLPDTYFTIQFLQAMDPAGTEAALSLVADTGLAAGLETEWLLNNWQLVVTPTERLALDTGYTLQIEPSALSASGGTLREGLDWTFTTIPQPAVLDVTPPDGSTQPSFAPDVKVQFASPMRIDTVKERIRVIPAPDEEINWYYNEWDWSLYGYFLEPSTEYEIRFLAGMEDIYGNRTPTQTTVRFSTAAREPSVRLMMPYEAPMLREGSEEGTQFWASYTNVDRIELGLYKLNPEQFMRLLGGRLPPHTFNPAASTRVWRQTETASGRLNERVVKSFTPTAANGSPLAPGFYYLGMDAPGITHEGPFVDYRLLFVANANLTFKTAGRQGLVWLTDLETGEPAVDQPVTLWDNRGNRLAQGQTDSDGLLELELPPAGDDYTRFAIAESDEAFGFASSGWGSGVNIWDYGIWIDQYSPTDKPTAYVFTERPIYRPGQPVYFKGIVRVDNDLDYQLPEAGKVRVKINSFEETVYDQELPLTEFGSFSDKFVLDGEAALGYYTIEVSLPDDPVLIGSLTFNVAEYRKPEFQVTATAEPSNLLGGESFTAVIQADYYSGGGVAGAQVQWSLLTEPFSFQPPDEYSTYSFSDFEEDVWGYQDTGESGSRIVAEGTGVTDSTGRFALDLPVDLSGFNTGRRLTFEATVTDLAQTAVTGRTSLTAHQSKVYPGIRSESYISEANEEAAFEMILLNWDGIPLPNHPLSVEIVERRWYSVQEQDAAGKIEWKTTVEEVPVAQIDDLTTDANGEARATFIPTKGGIYRARVTAADDQNNPARASAYLWVSDEEYVPWAQTNDRGFKLVMDKKLYQPGETARVLIASQFQGETFALVTVERGRIRSSEVIRLTGNSTIYELPIGSDLAPNAFISVMVVKGVDDTNPRPSFKMGITEFDVATGGQTLQVAVVPDVEQTAPGETVQFSVRTTDAAGKPVSAEVSLSLSDLATLSLLPPNSGPILDYFFTRRSLAVWTSMTMVNAIEDFNAEIEDEVQVGAGGGGGGGEDKGAGELGVIAVRQDFPDTALWEAHLVTDANGEATVAVSLPDNLTTWRMDARAVTQDTRVGQTTVDLVSTRPLLVRPQTPRFFIANDRAMLGAAIHNNTEESLSVRVALEAHGLALTGPAETEVTVPAGQQAYVTWDAVVDSNAERVDLIFRASAQGSLSGELEDANLPPQATLADGGLPVYRYTAPETVGTSGQLLEGGNVIEGILLPQNLEAIDAELTVEMAPSLAAGMTEGLKYLEHFPYECIEQTVSRFLPNVISTRAMKTAGLEDPELSAGLDEQVETALQRLYSWQNSDGGWGWWKNGQSDLLTSAYVVLGLVEAVDSGYSVDPQVVSRGTNFLLRRQVRSLTGLKSPYLVNRQAFLLYVLTRAGREDVSSTVQLYDQRARMATYAQAYLAQTLWLIDPDDPRLDTLLADFNSQAIVSASGTHWEEKEVDRWNWNTNTRTTAIVLTALGHIDPENPLNANAVRWLMSSRTEGRWLGTQETAWTLMALTIWMESSGELDADYDYAVALNGRELGSGRANRESLLQTEVFKVGYQDLLADELNRLALARDDGPGNLYYTAHLQVSLPVDQIEALDQGIVVARSYYRLEDVETPVTEAQQGELLLARLTLVAPNDLHYVVVDDPLPAGLEAVDQSLSTSPQSIEVPQQFTLKDLWWRGWGWWSFNHIEYRDEKVTLSADYLPAGTYVYTYLVRAGTPGEFRVVPATAQEFYFPEVYGRSAGSLFTVLR